MIVFVRQKQQKVDKVYLGYAINLETGKRLFRTILKHWKVQCPPWQDYPTVGAPLNVQP